MKLEIGYNTDFEIRKEYLIVEGCTNLTILYLSDLHFNGYSKALVTQIVQCIERHDPTIILFGGDYVDTKKGINYLEELLLNISQRQNLFAVAGNHDFCFGILNIKALFDKYGIYWIDNEVHCININGHKIQIVGKKPQMIQNKVDLSILCLHEPIDITLFDYQYDLAFAGHLHGCQFIFWETEHGLFPGKLFYKWNILKKRRNNCLYLISKGMGDTLPIRFNCKKDVILVEVKGKQ